MEITKETLEAIFTGVEFTDRQPYDYSLPASDKVFKLQSDFKAYISLNGERIYSNESWLDLTQQLWQHSNKK